MVISSHSSASTSLGARSLTGAALQPMGRNNTLNLAKYGVFDGQGWLGMLAGISYLKPCLHQVCQC